MSHVSKVSKGIRNAWDISAFRFLHVFYSEEQQCVLAKQQLYYRTLQTPKSGRFFNSINVISCVPSSPPCSFTSPAPLSMMLMCIYCSERINRCRFWPALVSHRCLYALHIMLRTVEPSSWRNNISFRHIKVIEKNDNKNPTWRIFVFRLDVVCGFGEFMLLAYIRSHSKTASSQEAVFHCCESLERIYTAMQMGDFGIQATGWRIYLCMPYELSFSEKAVQRSISGWGKKCEQKFETKKQADPYCMSTLSFFPEGVSVNSSLGI